jgi:hypothetical protein
MLKYTYDDIRARNKRHTTILYFVVLVVVAIIVSIGIFYTGYNLGFSDATNSYLGKDLL